MTKPTSAELRHEYEPMTAAELAGLKALMAASPVYNEQGAAAFVLTQRLLATIDRLSTTDREGEVERCARWCELSQSPRADQFAAHLRNLKDIPEWEPPT